MIYVKYGKNEDDISLFLNNFNTQRFITMVQHTGGLIDYIENMLESVYLYGSRTNKLDIDEENKLQAVINELRAILEIITSI